MNNELQIEVVYASIDKQEVISLSVRPGTTVLEAILQSEILKKFPEIDLQELKVGKYGKLCQLTDLVASGERIEIYRPLKIDPKDARRVKAKQQKNK